VAEPVFKAPKSFGTSFTMWVKLLAIPSGGFESRFRCLSGPRKRCDDSIAKAYFILPAFATFFMQSASRFNARQRTACPVELPEPVWHRENSVKRLHPRHAK
jgi:hypothetical protein